jgi:hypothetical protein
LDNPNKPFAANLPAGRQEEKRRLSLFFLLVIRPRIYTGNWIILITFSAANLPAGRQEEK